MKIFIFVLIQFQTQVTWRKDMFSTALQIACCINRLVPSLDQISCFWCTLVIFVPSSTGNSLTCMHTRSYSPCLDCYIKREFTILCMVSFDTCWSSERTKARFWSVRFGAYHILINCQLLRPFSTYIYIYIIRIILYFQEWL